MKVCELYAVCSSVGNHQWAEQLEAGAAAVEVAPTVSAARPATGPGGAAEALAAGGSREWSQASIP